jgi:hypothetical protein
VYEPATDVITLIGGYSYCWVLNEVYELRLGQQIPAFWTPPPAITDLTVMAVTESTVSLGWTAIRENAMAGRPQFYAIHSSPTPMSASDFDAAPFQIVKPANVTAGGFETTMQGELPPDSTFYFAVRLYDSHGSASPISNQPVARTLVGVEPPPPAGPSGIHLEFAANPSRPPIGVTWRADPSAAGASTRLRVHDLLGGLRRTFDLAGDQGTFQWDGRDDHGRRLPAGLYFARLTSGSKDAKARLVLIP